MITYLITLLLVGHTIHIDPSRTIDGFVSAYSREDSCHNKNKQGECIMANGQPVREGFIACPRNIKLGTMVIIEGERLTCADRTAKWVEEKYPNTFDVFIDGPESKQFGRMKVKAKIYDL